MERARVCRMDGGALDGIRIAQLRQPLSEFTVHALRVHWFVDHGRPLSELQDRRSFATANAAIDDRIEHHQYCRCASSPSTDTGQFYPARRERDPVRSGKF